MSTEHQPTNASEPVVMATLFAQRTARLEPLYHSARLVLTWSFRIGAALLLIGIVLALIQRKPLNHVTTGFDQVIPSVMRGDAAGVVDLAILWLMASPVFAVIVVAVGFFRNGEARYGVISLLVLFVLAISIALAIR